MKVFGIQETLADLNKFDQKFRRQITKDIQGGAGRLIVASARSMIPSKEPLTGMRRGSIIKGRSETAYNIKKVQAGIKTVDKNTRLVLEPVCWNAWFIAQKPPTNWAACICSICWCSVANAT